MKAFRYRALDAQNRIRSGSLQAEAADQAAQQLQAQNMTPIEIVPEAAQSDGLGSTLQTYLLQREKIRLNDLLLFSRQMVSITRSGIPIVHGLERLAESTPNRALAQTIRAITQDLEAGRSISDSFGQHADRFGKLYVNMLRIGEMTGDLSQSFEAIHEHLHRERLTLDQVKRAIRYPLFVMAAIAIAIAILTILVIPTFATIFTRVDLDLPWATRGIIAVSNFTAQWWWAILGALLVAFYGFRQWTRTEDGRLRWDRFRLRVPVIGSLLHRASMSRFVRALGLSLKAGVPITEALSGAVHSTGNTYLEQQFQDMQSGIERGERTAYAARQTGAFTPIALQMMTTGEETGQLDAMLTEIAEFYDRELAYRVENLSTALEPMITLAVGVMVLLLALGVFLPLWDLTQLAGR